MNPGCPFPCRWQIPSGEGKRGKEGNKSAEPTKSQRSPVNQSLPFSPGRAELLLAGEQNSFQLSVQGREIRDVLEKGKNQAVEEEKVPAERERRYLLVRHK